MKARTLLLLIAALLVTGCAVSGLFSKKEKKQTQRPEVLALEMKKKDPSVYWGEGLAPIVNNDLGQARELAKQRALQDLARKVEVSVEQDISQVIQSNITGTSESIRELFTQKVRIYTQSVLTNTKDLFVVDYPTPGNCTFLVYMSKAEYQQKVNKDLNMKKSAIRAAVQSGDAAMARNAFMIAANHWASAYEQLQNFFGDLPVQDDLNGDGRPEEVHAYLQEKMNQLFGNLELTFLNKDITYDATGTLTQKPMVQAKYFAPQGGEQFVANLPLKVEFLTGKGRVSGRLLTSKYGTAELNLTVDASYPQTTIVVSVDQQAIRGLNRFQLPRLSEAKLTIEKIKTVAIGIIFQNNGRSFSPEELRNEIKNQLLSRGYLTLDFNLDQAQVLRTDLTRAAQANADFLLTVLVKATGGSTVGNIANMYVSAVSGQVSLYRLPRGDEIATERIPSVKGFGVSAQVAGWDGYGKLKQNLLQKSAMIIERSL